MTQEQIDALKQAATAYYDNLVNIYSWCNSVARGMGFDWCSETNANADGFEFKTEWNGSYGASDSERFFFGYDKLLRDPADIVAELKMKQEEARKKREQDEAERKEEEQRAEYEELRKRFEGK